MTGDYNDAIFRSGELGNDVTDGKFAFGCAGGESILLDGVVLQVGENVFLAQKNLRRTLETGVTTVRDLNAQQEGADIALRNLINRVYTEK